MSFLPLLLLSLFLLLPLNSCSLFLFFFLLKLLTFHVRCIFGVFVLLTVFSPAHITPLNRFCRNLLSVNIVALDDSPSLPFDSLGHHTEFQLEGGNSLRKRDEKLILNALSALYPTMLLKNRK